MKKKFPVLYNGILNLVKKNTFPDENWISLRSGSIIFPQNSNCIIEERIDPRFSVFSRKMFKIDCFE